MPAIVTSNLFDENTANANVVTLSDTGVYLRLFTNNVTPDPSFTLASFTEATFAGYAAKDLDGLWGPVNKVIDGEYRSQLPVQTFTGGVGANQTVYGWYIEGGGDLYLSCRFTAPIVVNNGTSFQVYIDYEVWSKSIL